ncbi:MAG: divalent-cation tolerance protein CutA [Bacteroidota bacterium]
MRFNMFIIVYITHGTELAAKKISDYLLTKKLIACANIFPITSAYWWKNNIVKEGEWVSIVKTIPEHWEQLQSEVEAVHPYTTPCIMKFEVSANRAYEAWIRKEVIPASDQAG